MSTRLDPLSKLVAKTLSVFISKIDFIVIKYNAGLRAA